MSVNRERKRRPARGWGEGGGGARGGGGSIRKGLSDGWHLVQPHVWSVVLSLQSHGSPWRRAAPRTPFSFSRQRYFVRFRLAVASSACHFRFLFSSSFACVSILPFVETRESNLHPLFFVFFTLFSSLSHPPTSLPSCYVRLSRCYLIPANRAVLCCCIAFITIIKARYSPSLASTLALKKSDTLVKTSGGYSSRIQT